MAQRLYKNSKLISNLFSSKTRYDLDIEDENPTYTKLLKLIDKEKWFYTDKKIPYTHNEFGYRSNEISDIKDNDYVLTFGCSYSYGTGLFYEDTYSYKLSKELGLKNINLSIPGSGLNIQRMNTTLFVNNFLKIRKPKYVIYQYPHDYRVTLSLKIDDCLEINTRTANTGDDYINEEYIRKYYVENSGEKEIQDLLMPLYLNNIWEVQNIPVFHITFSDYIQEFKSDFQNFKILNIDDIDVKSKNDKLYYLARDLSHNGIEFHDKVYKTLLNKIKNG